MTNDQLIDIIIKELYPSKNLPIHNILVPYYKLINNDANSFIERKTRIKEIMEKDGLIYVSGEYIYLTHFSKTLVEKNNGWLNYLADKAREKNVQDELIQSSIRTNKLQRPLLWFTVGFSATTFIATIFSLVILYKDFKVHEKELQIQQNKDTDYQEKVEIQEKIKETVVPNLDSSSNSVNDSLVNNLKVDKKVKKK